MNCNNIVNHLSVKMADNDLPESSSFHLLGLSFCKDLSWTDHITSTSKSASMKIDSLCRARGYLTDEAIIHIYKSVIRPSILFHHRLGYLSLFYKYFHGRYSFELSNHRRDKLICCSTGPTHSLFARNEKIKTTISINVNSQSSLL